MNRQSIVTIFTRWGFLIRNGFLMKLQSSLPIIAFAFVLLVGTTTLMPSWLRFATFIFWVGTASWMMGGAIEKRTQARRMLFGTLAFASLLILTLTAFALLGSLTVFSVSCTVMALSLLATIFYDGALPVWSRFSDGLAHAQSLPYLLIALFGEVWMLVSFYLAWTAEPLVSPWQVFNFAIFVVYGVMTFSVVMFSATRHDRASLLLSVFHLLVSLSVAVMVYGIGFGFDPFIHRAAEMSLVRDGAIEPRRLLYLGQYALVGGMNLLTGVRVIFLDKWLVPLLASVAIPLVAFFSLRDGFHLSDRSARVFLHLALFFPSMYFVFTVPFNFTLLLLLLVSFLLPLADTWKVKGVLGLVSIVALVVHPLGGVPIVLLLLFDLIGGILRGLWRRVGWGVGFTLSLFALPALFVVYNLSAGSPAFVVHPHVVSRFLSLFADPHLQGDIPIPLILEWFYDALRWVPRIAVVATLVFVWRRRKTLPVSPVPVILLTLALCGSLFFLSGFFSFADVIAYEQLEFAGRLLQTILLLSTPWILVMLACLWETRAPYAFPSVVKLALVFSLFLTATWYLTYPQLNLKVRNAGASVSATDVEVVRFLESRYDGEPYLVLSHQMTSAIAIQEFGFRYYLETDNGSALWYAIPTGGKLYDYFLRMTKDGPTPELVEEVRDFANVQHIYFVTYDSWPNAGFVRARSAKFADASYGVQGTKLVIYEYQ